MHIDHCEVDHCEGVAHINGISNIFIDTPVDNRNLHGAIQHLYLSTEVITGMFF